MSVNDRKRERPDDYFKDWKEREALAEGMIPMVGQLARERNVKCYIYGRSLVNQSVLDIISSSTIHLMKTGVDEIERF